MPIVDPSILGAVQVEVHTREQAQKVAQRIFARVQAHGYEAAENEIPKILKAGEGWTVNVPITEATATRLNPTIVYNLSRKALGLLPSNFHVPMSVNELDPVEPGMAPVYDKANAKMFAQEMEELAARPNPFAKALQTQPETIEFGSPEARAAARLEAEREADLHAGRSEASAEDIRQFGTPRAESPFAAAPEPIAPATVAAKPAARFTDQALFKAGTNIKDIPDATATVTVTKEAGALAKFRNFVTERLSVKGMIEKLPAPIRNSGAAKGLLKIDGKYNDAVDNIRIAGSDAAEAAADGGIIAKTVGGLAKGVGAAAEVAGVVAKPLAVIPDAIDAVGQLQKGNMRNVGADVAGAGGGLVGMEVGAAGGAEAGLAIGAVAGLGVADAITIPVGGFLGGLIGGIGGFFLGHGAAKGAVKGIVGEDKDDVQQIAQAAGPAPVQLNATDKAALITGLNQPGVMDQVEQLGEQMKPGAKGSDAVAVALRDPQVRDQVKQLGLSVGTGGQTIDSSQPLAPNVTGVASGNGHTPA